MPGKRFALLIGSSIYQNIYNLPAVSNDVKILSEILRDPNLGGFDNVMMLLDGSCHQISKEIEKFFMKVTDNDLLLFYFSGHAAIVDHNLYFLVQDTSIDSIKSTAIRADFLKYVIKSNNTQQDVVIILDCSHGGEFIRNWESMSSNITILTSSDTLGLAYLMPSKNLSAFTGLLIEGLQSGKADLDNDGQINVTEMFEYIRYENKKLTLKLSPQLAYYGKNITNLPVIAQTSYRKLIKDSINRTEKDLNPFIYGKPISGIDSGVFVGRKDVIEIIKDILIKSQIPTLFLYGRRRTGKTSALLNLNRFLEHFAVAVPIDLQNVRFRESSSAFCKSFCKEISQYFPSLKDIYDRLNFQPNPFTALDEFLDAAERFVSEEKRVILLAFDEYERLDASHQDIFDTIRSIIQHRRHIVVLVAGSRRFSEIKNVNWSDYLINTQTIEISYLDRESAYKLITNPIDGFDLIYTENMPERILEITHCQPYLLQAVGSELVNYLNIQQRKEATFEDLEIVKRKVLTAAEAYFTNVWFDECNDNERIFLEQLILDEKDFVMFDHRNEPMRSLLRKETLERRTNQVYIAVPLFRQWIREKHLMMDA